MTLKPSLVLFALLTAASYSTVLAQTCDLIGPAVIKGKKFFDSRSKKYIPLKGVNYYPRPNAGELSTGKNRDFFGEEFRNIWERDIEHFEQLGINVVRIYAVNPGLDHSGFMCALKSAGIYVIVGLAASCQDCAITGMAAPECYPGALKERGQFVINVFSKYENVLAFSAGNEAHLYAPGEPPEHNAPCQKQFIRDMRAYIDSCENIRKIPVGVAVADFNRDEKALYYNCRSDTSDEFENAEWYGLNIYLHCDENTETIDDLDGFQGLLASHRNYSMSIPVVLSEFGCPNRGFPTIEGFEGQRNFLQVEALYSSEYEDYFAGGIVFEFSAEKSFIEDKTSYDISYPFAEYSRYNFGLGYLTPEDCDDVAVPCTFVPYPEFDTLASRYAAVGTSGTPDFDSFDPLTLDVTECPSNFPPLNSFAWESETVEDLECVGPNYVFICPNTAPECLPPFARPPPTPAPVLATPLPTITPTTVPTRSDCQEAHDLWSECALSNGDACSRCLDDQDPPRLMPGVACGSFVLWYDERVDCCENDVACSIQLEDVRECMGCPTPSPNDTSLPATSPDEKETPSPSSPVLATEDSPTMAQTNDTPAPVLSPGSTPTPLGLQPVEFVPTGLIHQEASSARGNQFLIWLWRSAYVLLLFLLYC